MLKIFESLHDGERAKCAIAKFYERNRDKFLVSAMRHTKNLELAEDALHNAFVVILGSKEKFAAMEPRHFFNCVNFMVKNRIIDINRKNKYISDISIDSLANELSYEFAAFDGSASAQEERTLLLYKCLGKISIDDYSLLIMKYVTNLSSKEIAGILGIKANAVDARFWRAKEKVRKLSCETEAAGGK